MINLPDIRQNTKFSCGSACVQAICMYFEVGGKDQKEYIKRLHTTHSGTHPDDIVDFLKKKHLKVEKVEKMSLDKLEKAVSDGKPVICAIQSNNYGHYVVAIGVDSKSVHFHDPEAGKRSMAKDKFVDDWHDRDKNGKFYNHLGIIAFK